MIKKVISILLLLLLIIFFVFPILSFANEASIRYQVHLQDIGWISTVKDGAVAGTTGQARRLEAIALAMDRVSGKISYEVHCETFRMDGIKNRRYDCRYNWNGKKARGNKDIFR